MENIDDMLNKAIAEKDLRQIRQILSVFITGDQSFSKAALEDKIGYCVRMGFSESELFEEFDGVPFNENSDEWDEAYFTKQRVKFDSNFSRERLEHLKRVGKKLFLEPAKEERRYSSTKPPQYSSRTSHSGGSSHNAALGGVIVAGGAGAVIGGFVAAASGAAVLAGVLIGGIAGAAVGAGVGAVLENKDA
jgi:hypothetical protein